jgi:cell division transport system permease protein
MNKNKTAKSGRLKGQHTTATLSMSLVLFLIGLVSLLLFVAHDMSVFVRENINLSVILNDELTPTDRIRLQKYLQTAEFTKSVEYVSKEDALKDHIASLGENPEDFLGYNPLKASLEVKLKAAFANSDSVASIEKKLKVFDNIDSIAYQKDLVSLVNDNVRKVSYVLLGLAAALLFVSITLIRNTVRLTVYSNRFLINTMKLVGASNRFIRKPYLLRGLLNGLAAALIALLLLSAAVYYVLYEFGINIMAIQPFTVIYVTGIVILAGVILTVVSAYFAVGRYLRMKTNDMYYI